jgi:hypothetical protein
LTFKAKILIINPSERLAKQFSLLPARVAQWKRSRLVIGRLVGSNPLSG